MIIKGRRICLLPTNSNLSTSIIFTSEDVMHALVFCHILVYYLQKLASKLKINMDMKKGFFLSCVLVLINSCFIMVVYVLTLEAL